MTELPQPTKHAFEIYEVTSAIMTEFVPGLSVIKALSDIAIQKRLEAGQALLIGEISRTGLTALSNEKWSYYVPAAYRFFEQIRIGEYDHNLSVLAKLIAGDLEGDIASADVGKIGRAASKLEMLPREHLVALSRCERAFEIYQASDVCDGYWICIDAHDLLASFADAGKDVSLIKCYEWLHELSSRGLLTASGRPSKIGGIFYYRNSVYNEIFSAIQKIAMPTEY
ncbi:hypothetical protein [Rhizobium alvei]|uniref:Uncharacterized protein n=1 Tax=Rhizobium alvei TaxID=1132659 RepID=A0ABT8YTU6_9HYPH|nr:hypothetical protein [Rhizobium alvei]MDO6967011.1 hypothetical protein [Rhizobium alvei]